MDSKPETNDFVFFARRGELARNRTEDHELSMQIPENHNLASFPRYLA